jgi:hypothetical protein
MMFAQPCTSFATRISANRYFIESVLAGRRGDLGTRPLGRRQWAVIVGSGGVLVAAVLAGRRSRRARWRRGR